MRQKNCVFSARAPPLALVYIGAKGALENLRVRNQKWISQKSTKGGQLYFLGRSEFYT